MTTAATPVGPTLLIGLPAKAEGVPLVRHVVTSFAERLGMVEPTVGDLKTVVTEACANAVIHAYSAEPGTIDVRASQEGAELTIVVRDRGGGLGRSVPGRDEDAAEGLGLGLDLIAALCSAFEITLPRDGGTEVMMRLPLPAAAV